MADGNSSRAVPITMGSPRFVTIEVARFRCTHAWFPPDTTLEPHTHDRATFGVMVRGGFDLTFSSPAIRRRSLECRPGTVFTEPAGETHGNGVGSGGASVVVIQIDPDAADSTIGALRPLLTERINHFQSQRIAQRATTLAREIRGRDRLAALAIESLVLGMLADAGRHDTRWTRSHGPPPWLDLAEQYVRANFRESLRIADIAEAVGVHPAHLATMFSEVHRVPLATFIRRLRLDWASDRLARTDASISSIAASAGFADQSHLTRAFKEYTGHTPAAYRKAVAISPRPAGSRR
jgi:AraC family transcriptional regulator